MDDGQIYVADLARPDGFETVVAPVNLSLREFSTLPDESGAQDLLVGLEDGSSLAWSGELAVYPLKSTGRMEIKSRGLQVTRRWLAEALVVDLGDETEVDLSFDYALDASVKPDGRVRVNNILAEIRDLSLAAKSDNQVFFRLPRLQANGEFDWPEAEARISQISVSEPALELVRYPDGDLNLQRIAEEAAAVQAPEQTESDPPADEAAMARADTPAQATAPPLSDEESDTTATSGFLISLTRLNLESGSVSFIDETIDPPLKVSLEPLAVELRDVSSAMDSTFRLDVSSGISSGGSIELTGQAGALPPQAELELALKELNLTAAAPYLAEVARVVLKRGQLDSAATVQLPKGAALPDVSADIKVSQFELEDGDQQERLLAFESLQVEQLKLAGGDQSVEVSQIQATAPYLRLVVASDGSTNFSNLAAPTENEDPGAEEETPEASSPDIQIGRIAVSEGEMLFSDFSLPLPFTADVTEMSGEINTLIAGSREPSPLSFQGAVGEFGEFRSEGAINVFDPTLATDIDVQFRNVAMPDFTPYSAKFAGYRIDDGTLTLDLGYGLDQGKLDGENRLVIEQLTLGEKVDSPDAINAPVTIDLDIPVPGDVNDPEFSFGSVILKAITNVLVKVAAAPFNLLGQLVGAGEGELEAVFFRSGSSEISPPERQRLDKLADALKQRPSLVLSLEGAVDPSADALAIQNQRVDASLETRLEEGRTNGDSEGLVEQTTKALEQLTEEGLGKEVLIQLEQQATVPPPGSEGDARPQLDVGAYNALMREALAQSQTISEQDLTDLAGQRTTAIRSYLTGPGEIAESRIVDGEKTEATLVDDEFIPMKLKLAPAG